MSRRGMLFLNYSGFTVIKSLTLCDDRSLDGSFIRATLFVLKRNDLGLPWPSTHHILSNLVLTRKGKGEGGLGIGSHLSMYSLRIAPSTTTTEWT